MRTKIAVFGMYMHDKNWIIVFIAILLAIGTTPTIKWCMIYLFRGVYKWKTFLMCVLNTNLMIIQTNKDSHNFASITDYSKTNQIKETVCIIILKNELHVSPYKNNENVYDIN